MEGNLKAAHLHLFQQIYINFALFYLKINDRQLWLFFYDFKEKGLGLIFDGYNYFLRILAYLYGLFYLGLFLRDLFYIFLILEVLALNGKDRVSYKALIVVF